MITQPKEAAMHRFQATPEVRRAAAEVLRASAALVAAFLPTLPAETRSRVDLVRAGGATLRVVGEVDGLASARVVVEVLGVDGTSTKPLASISVRDLPLRRTP
jgi:hypothetical protein